MSGDVVNINDKIKNKQRDKNLSTVGDILSSAAQAVSLMQSGELDSLVSEDGRHLVPDGVIVFFLDPTTCGALAGGAISAEHLHAGIEWMKNQLSLIEQDGET